MLPFMVLVVTYGSSWFKKFNEVYNYNILQLKKLTHHKLTQQTFKLTANATGYKQIYVKQQNILQKSTLLVN